MFLEIFDFFFFIHSFKNFNVFFFFSLLFSPKIELNTNKYGNTYSVMTILIHHIYATKPIYTKNNQPRAWNNFLQIKTFKGYSIQNSL